MIEKASVDALTLWRGYYLMSDPCRIFCPSTAGAGSRKLAACWCKNETSWKISLARLKDGVPAIQHELGPRTLQCVVCLKVCYPNCPPRVPAWALACCPVCWVIPIRFFEPGKQPPMLELWLLTHRDVRTTARLRTLMQFIAGIVGRSK